MIESAAEEARLMYVALTRAKRSVTYYVGDREEAWWNAESFGGNSGAGKMLEGSTEEVAISWAWEATRYNLNPEAVLSYIEHKVQVGDKLSVAGDGRSIFHRAGSSPRQQVGFLSKQSGQGGQESDLEVSAVLRYPYNGEQYLGGITAQSVNEKGWGLVVLAAGILRR